MSCTFIVYSKSKQATQQPACCQVYDKKRIYSQFWEILIRNESTANFGKFWKYLHGQTYCLPALLVNGRDSMKSARNEI